MDSTYIRCLDEGRGPVDRSPNEEGRNTALMVNPKASQSVLLDAAAARAGRIIDVTKIFIDVEDSGLDFPREDSARLLTTVCAMAHEIKRLLDAAQYHPWGLEPMRKSYRQTIEAAEALVEAVNINELKHLPEDKQDAITNAIFEMEGDIGAVRYDYLDAKEVTHE